MFKVQLQSEWRKAKTSLYWWGIGILIVCANVLVSAFFGYAGLNLDQSPIDIHTHNAVSMLLTVGMSFSFVLPLILGLLMVSSEFQNNTVFYSFLGNPSRINLLAAKLVSCAFSSLFFTAIGLVLSFTVLGVMIKSKNPEITVLTSEAFIAAGMVLLVAVFLAIIGGALGALVHKPLIAIVGIVLWAQVVEPIVRIVAPASVQRFLPSVVVDSSLGETFLAKAFGMSGIEQSTALIVLFVVTVFLSLAGGWKYSQVEI